MYDICTRRIRVNSDCNQNCIFCSSGIVSQENREKYTTAYLKSLISDRNTLTRLNLTGGEPTLRRDLSSLIRLAKNVGYQEICLLTNGNRFSDESYVKKIKKSGLTEAIISIQHFDSQVNDRITQVKGTFEHKCKGIYNLIKNKINTTAYIVIFSLNAAVVKELVEYLYKKFHITLFAFAFLEPNCERVQNAPWLIPDIKRAFISLQQAIDYCRKNELKYYIPYDGAIPFCVYRKYGITINKPENIMGVDLHIPKIQAFFCRGCKERVQCKGFLREYAPACIEILLKGKAAYELSERK